jgi:predicted ATPase
VIIKIEVDGFKSLSDFELVLEPGLNILVGSNGSGKTNIIVFFEFLNALFSSPISEAVSKLGGAGSVFKKLEAGEYQSQISAKIYGCVRTYDNKFVIYEYEFEISLSPEKDLVYFSRQQLAVAVNRRKKEVSDVYNKKIKWDLEINSSLDTSNSDLGVAKTTITKIDLRKIQISRWSAPGGDRKKTIEFFNKEFSGPFFLQESLLRHVSRLFSLSHVLAQEVQAGDAINIDPTKAKQNEDSAAPPGIRRDGAGLTATLYALSRTGRAISAGKNSFDSRGLYWNAFQREQFRRPDFYYQRNEAMFKRITDLAKLINPEISKISVESSALDNSTQVIIWMSTKEKTIKLPFALMSDGTVKWIALITAILTHKSIFAIEEPENFLHPHMQKELLSIMRQELKSRRGDSFVIMTTHSESLLNAASADEIVVVKLAEGRTTVTRPKNIKVIAEEIRRTGFGLGYYYVSEALNND